jgi:hypothetical protein
MNEPYMPSNGTEGEWFMDQFCYRCQKDTINRGGFTQCSILGRSFLGEQPKQWVYVDDKPTCTSFKDMKDRKRHTPITKGQLDIFETKEEK